MGKSFLVAGFTSASPFFLVYRDESWGQLRETMLRTETDGKQCHLLGRVYTTKGSTLQADLESDETEGEGVDRGNETTPPLPTLTHSNGKTSGGYEM